MWRVQDEREREGRAGGPGLISADRGAPQVEGRRGGPGAVTRTTRGERAQVPSAEPQVGSQGCGLRSW